ncbi:MAG: hypothetical protein IJ849_06160 [Selenomonadaceae bacterium]|nr:hypothetical protein [Selenomonadaceae bacterium]
MITNLKNGVKRNLPAKIIALIVAFTLWGVVMEDQNPLIENSLTLEVTSLNPPTEFRVSPLRDKVKIKVRGQRSAFLALDNPEENGYSAAVDMEGLGEGMHQLKPQVTVPQGVELLEVQPETVNYNFEAIISKNLPIDLVVNGATAPGTAVAKITQAAAHVTATGPRSFLDKAIRAIGYVGLAGNDTDFTLDVPLTAINDEGREVPNITLSEETTSVEVQLARGLSKKIVSVKPVLGGKLPEGYSITEIRVDPLKIEIAGDEAITETLTAVATEPIKLDNMTTPFNRTVKLSLPEGVTVTNQMVSVNVKVERKAVKEKPKEEADKSTPKETTQP